MGRCWPRWSSTSASKGGALASCEFRKMTAVDCPRAAASTSARMLRQTAASQPKSPTKFTATRSGGSPRRRTSQFT